MEQKESVLAILFKEIRSILPLGEGRALIFSLYVPSALGPRKPAALVWCALLGTAEYSIVLSEHFRLGLESGGTN